MILHAKFQLMNHYRYTTFDLKVKTLLVLHALLASSRLRPSAKQFNLKTVNIPAENACLHLAAAGLLEGKQAWRLQLRQRASLCWTTLKTGIFSS